MVVYRHGVFHGVSRNISFYLIAYGRSDPQRREESSAIAASIGSPRRLVSIIPRDGILAEDSSENLNIAWLLMALIDFNLGAQLPSCIVPSEASPYPISFSSAAGNFASRKVVPPPPPPPPFSS